MVLTVPFVYPIAVQLISHSSRVLFQLYPPRQGQVNDVVVLGLDGVVLLTSGQDSKHSGTFTDVYENTNLGSHIQLLKLLLAVEACESEEQLITHFMLVAFHSKKVRHWHSSV